LAEPFERAVSAALPRVEDQVGEGLGRALLNALFVLRSAVRPLLHDNYQTAYEAGGAEFYMRFESDASNVYAQMHTTVALASALVGGRAQPPLEAAGLAGLESLVDAHSGHPLGAELRRRRREMALLRWLGRVRNKAVQHRVESGSLDAKAIVLRDGIVLIRTRPEVPARQLRKARALLTGFNRKYSLNLDTGGRDEPFAYLDLVSHSLYELGRFGDFDTARRVVEDARLFHLTVSPRLIRNTDVALASLIDAAKVDPATPLADH
jgi:hypothetical protein